MVTLEPMSEAEFESFQGPAVAEYAAGHVADGQWMPSEALEKARKEFQDLLPSAWVYDVRIDEVFQRHGYGSAAFGEMEKKVWALGGNRIALHVFGSHHAAREMYEKLGYQTTNVLMS
jgi:GNAT superfamily N-acetyltransferase